MAGSASKQQGPSSVDEGLNNVLMAITACMTAPDAMDPKNHDPLMKLYQGTLGVKAQIAGKGGQPQQGQQPPPGGGAMQGGGTNIRQMMGGAPSGPSAGMGGGPTSTGMSAEDMRAAAADQAS
jgi:hypothetical protein